MTDENQNPEIKTYRSWVGVILSLLIPGTVQFLAGKKLLGLGLFGVIIFLQVAGMFCLASPLVPGDLPAFILFAASLVLWLVVLVKSCQPIPQLRWRGWILFALLLTLSFSIFPAIKVFIAPFKIPTASMSPTIQGNRKLPDGTTVGGDHLFAEKYAYWFSQPKRGDIVVFKATGLSPMLPENELYIKRVIGVPGDVLSVQYGQLYNHGQIMANPTIIARLHVQATAGQNFLVEKDATFVVSNGCYFVVGDNSVNSLDSRHWGALPEANIIGKVSKIYWPLERAGKLQ